MKFKALITSILVSTSSIALADDYSVKKHFDDDDITVRDHRGNGECRRQPAWVPLSQMMTASRRNVIRINEHDDELRAIRLKSGSGATYIYSISLRYEDGHRENITVGKWLYAGMPELTFDLAQNHELDRVTINTWTSTHSTYQVLGQRARRIVRPPIVEPLPPSMPPMPPISTLPAYGFVVAKDLTFANTAGYVHLPVGSDKGNFHKVRIESTGAGTFIGRIYVTFPTGLHQMFDVNKALYRGETLDLELSGKGTQQITAITVMAGSDVRAVGPSASRFAVTLL
jgi:hypothetical protein